jgi:hypothetical protein
MINIDKLKHAMVGFIIVTLFVAMGHGRMGLVIAILAGVAKEIYDYFHPQNHTCDGLDILSTITGALVALTLL